MELRLQGKPCDVAAALLLLPTLALAAHSMDMFDKQIREELLARIERDPHSIAFYNPSTANSCATIVAVAVAFGIGLAIGTFWFS